MKVFEIYDNSKDKTEVADKIIKSYDKALCKIKTYSEDLYKDLQKELYTEIYGCHFNKWLLDKAVSELVNEDGTTGGHWTIEQTTSVARQYGIEFTNFNEYDWNFVMNAMYSDYFGAVPNEVSYYVKLAKKFIEDKDAPKGKALYYYWAMKY